MCHDACVENKFLGISPCLPSHCNKIFLVSPTAQCTQASWSFSFQEGLLSPPPFSLHECWRHRGVPLHLCIVVQKSSSWLRFRSPGWYSKHFNPASSSPCCPLIGFLPGPTLAHCQKAFPKRSNWFSCFCLFWDRVLLCVFVWDKVSPCNCGCPRTHSDLPASVSRVLVFKGLHSRLLLRNPGT